MPSRGAPWRGVGQGQKDRIGTEEVKDDSLLSEDIKDGTIKEVDLDSALQAKVNTSGGHVIEDEGTPLSQRPNMNFIGAGVTASDDGETTNITIAGVADGVGYDQVNEEGTPLIKRSTLQFVGDLVTASDSESTTTINVKPLQIQDEGVNLNALRPTIDFVGAGVVATDGPGLKTTITIPGGGGSLSREEIGSPNDDFWIYDEFFYPTFADIGLHLEHVESSGSVPSGQIGGVVQQNTSSVDNNSTRLNTCGAGGVAIDGDKKVILRWRARLSDSGVNTAFICGLTPPSNGPQSPHPYVNKPGPIISFFYDGGGNIDTYSSTDAISSNVEQTDTGVAMDTNFHTYDIEVDPVIPNIVYKIDGNIVKTQTTNLPTGTFVAWIGVQNGSAASRNIRIDSWFLYNQR